MNIRSMQDDVDVERQSGRSCDEVCEQINSEKLEAAGRLAAWLAHQINNPLGTISGNAQLLSRRLERDISDPEALAVYMRYIETIRSQIERCAQITAEMLDFTRPRDVENGDVDIIQAVRDAFELASFGKSECSISITSNSASLTVQTDKELIARVLYEVLSNALRSASGDGTVTVEVEQPETGGMVRITVKDTGTGIADDALPRIFEPFFSTREKSRGLGLTRSLKFMRQLGGNIEVCETGPGGTAMAITLPTGRV
ncbi:MAG: ATP-binding protein [Armatimonadota bacterium]